MSIQVTVDIYSHYVPGSNRQAVNRLDLPVDNPKTEGQSATIRNWEILDAKQGEKLSAQVIECVGAPDTN